MSMFRALRTLNSVEAGMLDGAALDTLLADPGRFSEWQVLSSMQGQVERMFASDLTMNVITSSGNAMRAMATETRKFIYDAPNLRRIAPSAWSVHVPDATDMVFGTSTDIARWSDALGNTSRDLFQATAAARPVIDHSRSPLFGQPVVNFVSNDFLTVGEAFASTLYTIFMVYRRNTVSTADGFIGGTAEGFSGIAASTTMASHVSGSTAVAFAGAGQQGAAAATWGVSRWRRPATGGIFHSLNGGVESNVNSTQPSFAAVHSVGRVLSNIYLAGQVAEIWMISGNGDASSAEIVRVTNMLKNKYGF